LTKSNTAHETEIGGDPSNELAQCPEHLSKEKINPPSDIEKYYTMNVAQQIRDEYVKILS
jgi:hypothetical protein